MKRFIPGLLTAILLLSLFTLCTLPVSAEGTVTGEGCGEGLTWQLDTATGELVISGEGAMTNYSIPQPAPWYGHRNLITSIRLEEGVTTVGNYAFLYCSQAVSVSLPQTLTAVNAFAFWQCTALDSVVIPEGVTVLGSGAFQNCSSLTSVTLPETLTHIDLAAFSACSRLETVTLPHSLTTLGKSVFGGCPLSRVLYNGTEEEWAAIDVGSNNAELTDALLFHPGHTYDQEIASDLYWISDPTCEEAAAYYKSCVCGEAGDESFFHGAPAGHRYEDKVVAPTCEEAGYTVHTCSVCSDSYEDTPVDPKGHTPGAPATCDAPQLCSECGTQLADKLEHDYVPAVTLSATCTDSGIRTYTCSHCRDSYDEVIDATGHTPGPEATCTVDQICTVCETVLTVKKGHSYQDSTVLPTCDEQGYTLHTCTVCEDSYRDNLVEPKGHTPGPPATCQAPQLCTVCGGQVAEKLPHDYEEVVTLAPTCTETGLRTYTCTVCEDTYNDVIKENGHTPGDEATCTTDQVCTVCAAVLVPKLNHDYKDTVVPPTCTEQGYTVHVCNRCSETVTDSYVAARGHTPGEAASCFAPQLCTVCEAVLQPQFEHDYQSVVTKEPTCTEPGIHTYTCRHCGDSYERSVAANEHTPGAGATCTQAQTCTACGAVLTPMLGHNLQDTTVPPTCTEQGYTAHTCSRCSVTYLDTFVSAKGHVPGEEATCHAPQICTVCNQLLAEAIPHSYVETSTEATCTDTGLVIRVCTLCEDRVVISVTPAKGHANGDWSLVSNPDVGVPGLRQKTCSACSAVLETETFWETHSDSEPDESTMEPEGSSPIQQEEGGGCQNVGGNILVIVIALAALVLLWSVDFRRRH